MFVNPFAVGYGMSLAFANPILATADASSFGGILQMATEMLTWAITSMGSIVTFIAEHPLLTVFLVFTIVGFAVGLLMRIWHSVGG